MLQAGIEGGYARFVGLVATSRGKTPAQIDTIAQGRVWDGGTARQLGLVDQFGGLDDALAYAAKAADLGDGDWHASYLGSENDPYASLLERLTRDDDSAPPTEARDFAGLVAQRQMDMVGRAVADARRLLGGQGAQAYCLECPVGGAAPARVDVEDIGMLARIARMLGIAG
jgi:protease-4